MTTLDEMIDSSTDVRELKRALSVKMGEQGLAGTAISELLQVSPQFVSKWQKIYAQEGMAGLKLGYTGSTGYLNEEQRAEVLTWIGRHTTLTLEELIEYLGTMYGVIYQSRQSYYALLSAGGMSYHKTEKINPKQDESQVQTRQDALKKNWRRTGMPSNAGK